MRIAKILSLLLAFSTFTAGSATLPEYKIITHPTPSSYYGNISRLAVSSDYLNSEIIVDVWTPKQYEPASANRYPVIYAHDGQNLFDASFSFAGVPWSVDKACSQLANDPNFVVPIIVGINNRGAQGLRPNDYFPEKALDYISPDETENTYIYDTCHNQFFGDEHAAFVALELKPLIDSLYNTSPERSATFTMGSSMGALAALYLLCEYPQTFGGAACLSTHWVGSLNLNSDYIMNDDEVCANAILQYLKDNLPSENIRKIYLDQGTEGWDATYLKYEVIARDIVKGKGYGEENGHLMLYNAEGAGHNEWYWQQRIEVLLKFLLNRSYIESAGVVEISECSSPSSNVELIYHLTGKSYPLSFFDHLPSGLYIYKGKKFIKR